MRKVGSQRILGAALLSLLTSVAWSENGPPAVGGNGDANAVSISTAASSSRSEGGAAHASAAGGAGGSAQASQTQTAAGGAGGAGGNASNLGNAQYIEINSKDRLQAPGLAAPAIFASGPCSAGWSAGLSVPGGALTGGKSKADPNCDRREVARVLMPINPALALRVLCSDPFVAAIATKEDCVYHEPVVRLPDHVVYATQDDLEALRKDNQTALERAFKKSNSK